jgi:methylase of polypeptide subunit release factors
MLPLKERRESYSALVRQWQMQPDLKEIDLISTRLRSGLGLVPFNWEVEFPEVFDRDNGGFDSIVGNPPFAGKNTIADANAQGYPEWLKTNYAESHGNSDLVAYFFRRSFDLLRRNGTLDPSEI